MLDKMVEDIWKFLQPKMDEKFAVMSKQIGELKIQLDRIEGKLDK